MEHLPAFFGATIDFLSEHTVLTYVVVFVGSYADTIVGVNFVIRGEIFFIASSALAGTGVLNIWLVSFLVLTASVLGDHTSYWLGLKYGKHLFKEGRWIFNPANEKRGADFFKRFGAKAVLIARLLGPLTWITPFMAGMYRVPYSEFLPYNIAGVCIGVGQFLVIGYVFGTSYARVLALEQRYAFLIILAIVAAAIIFHVFKKHISSMFEKSE